MSYDLFDLAQGLMGRPDPRQQLYAALGQAPGQPGSPQGPQPLAGQNAPPGGPAGPGGSPDPSGGPSQPQQPPQAPPQPQAYQSPPDLAQAYMALSQRDQARQQFNSGLGLLAASAYPGRHPEMIMKAMSGGGEDAGTMFNNLMQLQQYQQQNQALQAYRQGVPGMLKGMGLNDDQIKAYTPLALADPSFATKIAETQLGVGGSPAWMAQKHAEAALTAQGKPIPWTPGDPSSFDAYTKATTESSVKNATDITTAKNDASTSFNSVDPQWKTVQDNLAWLNDPAHRDAVISAIQKPELVTTGQVGENLPTILGGQDQDVLDAKGRLDTLQAQLKTEAFKNTKNVRSNREAQFLGDAATNIFKPTNSPTAITDGLADLQNKATAGRANATLAAGRPIPAEWAPQADPTLLDPKSQLFNGGSVAPPAQGGGGGGGSLKPMPDATKSAAQALIAKDPTQRGPLIQHLRQQGIDPTGL